MMNKFIFLFTTMIYSEICFSQDIITRDDAKGRLRDNYNAAYASNNWAISDSLALVCVREKPNFIDGWILLGENARKQRKYDEAIKDYMKVKSLSKDYLYDINLRLADNYIFMEEYAAAKKCLDTFLLRPKLSAAHWMLAGKMIADCQFAQEAIKNPLPFNPVNMGSNINSSVNDVGPYLTADGKYLYFTRLIEDRNYQQEDIYYAVKTGDRFGQAIPVSNKINSLQYGEGAVCISVSGKFLIFSSYDRPDGAGNSDLYIARKTGDEWERPNNMGIPINSPGWEGAPSLSADGKTLFFSSIRSGGVGQRDIWMSTLRDDGSWSPPLNLGDSINTSFDEESPFIHPDGQTLYFASNGLPGMGNYDLFYSKKLSNGKWSEAVNLGYPINTSGYENSVFVSTDGAVAFYSSERKNSYGKMDIYQFEMPPMPRPGYTSYIKGNVFDAQTREPIYANIQVYDLETGKLFATLSSDKVNGTFLSTLPAGRNYGITVLKDGYLFYSQNISLVEVKEGVPYEVDIPLHKIEVGEKVVLNNIFFESEKYELKSESNTELEMIVKLLDKNPTLKIEIGGHTDNSGTEEKNKTLSENRARSVYDALISKGVEADKLSYKGYASAKPVASNNNPDGRAKNRRTEFVVTMI